MGALHPVRRRGNTTPMLATVDVLAHSPPGSVLHRDAFQRRTVTQRGLLLIRQTEGHRHDADGIRLIPDTGEPTALGTQGPSQSDQVSYTL